MIRSLKHKGLRRLFRDGERSGVRSDLATRIEDVLGRLNVAERAQDLDLPGYRLHPMHGDLKGYWSVTVSANWRIIFRFEGGDAWDVELIDYH